MSPRFVSHTTCLHGLDAGHIRLSRDELHNALYVELDARVRIRLDLNDPDADMERDRDGLLRLAEAAMQAAQELGQLLEARQ